MERNFSPIVRKIAGEAVSKPKRTFSPPTEVCLEDWWLSKPEKEDGIAVSGRPMEIRKSDDAKMTFDSSSPMRRYASREVHSTKVVKRHGATMLETSDGLLISLCGFINKYRTQENGFTPEACRDFIYGFPFNWDDYAEGLISNENIIESLTPEDLDSFSGAQLHDLVLCLNDTERDVVIEKINKGLVLNPEAELGVDIELRNCRRKSLHSSRCGKPSGRLFVCGSNNDGKGRKKQRLETRVDVYSEAEQEDVALRGCKYEVVE